jgi:RHS repeat-associated protein
LQAPLPLSGETQSCRFASPIGTKLGYRQNFCNKQPYATFLFRSAAQADIAACLGNGTSSSDCGSPSGTGFGYDGYRYDPETGLYHTGARYYDPRLGRFLQPDPIGQAGGVNLYAYVGNDPLNAVDPSGLCPACWGAAIGFGVDLGAQLLFTGTYDWRQGVAATGAGALTGGVSAIIGRTVATVGGRAIANAAVGATASAVQAGSLNVVAGQQNNVAGAAILGGVGGAVGSYIGDKIVAASQAGSQAAFDALSTADKLGALGMLQANPSLTIGAARPAAVAFGNAAGTAVGDAIGALPSDSIPSLIPGAHAATPSSLK